MGKYLTSNVNACYIPVLSVRDKYIVIGKPDNKCGRQGKFTHQCHVRLLQSLDFIYFIISSKDMLTSRE